MGRKTSTSVNFIFAITCPLMIKDCCKMAKCCECMLIIYMRICVFTCVLIWYYTNEALRGGGRGRGYLFPCSPRKYGLVSLFVKTKSWFSMFPFPQDCLCSPVPIIFRPLFPCSLEKNAFIPLFPKTPGRIVKILSLDRLWTFRPRPVREKCR